MCGRCGTHLTTKESLVSKNYQGKYGRAHLYKKVVNVSEGVHEERSMTTGVHVVCDVNCAVCFEYIGWKYISAFEKDQKFKEGKYILERNLIKNIR
ncbi:hypothetical protein BB559_004310 [Furculomyces boomerangus]|nr:hypothetical protein BB559_004310 [Furculomyces boomerangus]PVZ98942.1 hypothetical protein BB558_005074 [Smittium angustum]